eukprot:TRINITY_DN97692_c0_g1_i1.p1 TRINITY_DN97692_c0_g1~~TRINITY_DN97692_c0_g1_i1.p1  ORF type:complete len:261 (-),score=64.38 TRINITY_DN97692_c0_g1_i1:39-821(-)
MPELLAWSAGSVKDVLLSAQADVVLQCLPDSCVGCLRATGHSLSTELQPHIARRLQSAWQQLVPSAAARSHYEEILGCCEDGLLLYRRRWLVGVDKATQYDQWRTPTAVARLMNGVSLDGGDLFAALKRAFLASQVPELAEHKSVVCWMHVLGAVEEQDPIQSKIFSGEAWEALASQLTQETAHWPLQTAHFVDALGDFEKWLLVENGPSAAKLTQWLEKTAVQMEQSPIFGRYGPAGDSSQLRPRHVARIIARLKARGT